jgi:predicted nucleic acid-binding protein
VKAYLDTSAIVKLLVRDEPGGAVRVREVVDAADVAFTSRIAHPEGQAALASVRRSGRLMPREHARARQRLMRMLEQVAIVELTAPLGEAAGAVAERYRLRALDAIHLASALAGDDGDTVMVTWDRELAVAARRAGLGLAATT